MCVRWISRWLQKKVYVNDITHESEVWIRLDRTGRVDVWSERKELKVRTLEKFRDNVTHHKTFMTISYVPSMIVRECVSQDRRELHIIGTSSTSSAMQGMIASNTVVKGDIENWHLCSRFPMHERKIVWGWWAMISREECLCILCAVCRAQVKVKERLRWM